MPHSPSRGYIPNVSVMLYLAVMPNPMNQYLCSMATFVDAFIQILSSCYRYADCKIDLAIKFLTQVVVMN